MLKGRRTPVSIPGFTRKPPLAPRRIEGTDPGRLRYMRQIRLRSFGSAARSRLAPIRLPG
jgi:hypothetical protein